MEPITILSAVEQVAVHLREELLRGGLSGKMPGVNPLLAELGVGHKTVNAGIIYLLVCLFYRLYMESIGSL
jgi:hypothetical protein